MWKSDIFLYFQENEVLKESELGASYTALEDCQIGHTKLDFKFNVQLGILQ